jgi:CRP/FNR family transcriptional regulator, cyclic AMP receptor protein
MARSIAAPRDWLDNPLLGDSLRALAHCGEVRRYAKGTLILQEGDFGDTLYVILHGRLRAFSVEASNGREITYGHYGPGEYVGEFGLDGGPRAASVIAMESSVCAVITRPTLEAFVAGQPSFAFELLSKVALNDVYGRLKLLLDSLAVAAPGGIRTISERLTHQDIANRIGCTREMVSRVMKDLEKSGCLRLDGGLLQLTRALPARW